MNIIYDNRQFCSSLLTSSKASEKLFHKDYFNKRFVTIKNIPHCVG